MSIENEINRISTNVGETLNAIEEMGGTVPEGATSNDMAAAARTIPVGAKIDDITSSTNTTYSSSKIDALLNEQKEANDAQDEAIAKKLNASELPTAINTALEQAKESGQFDGAPGKDGKDGADGAPGAKGEPGKDYVLTEADREEIAEMAAELVEVPEGGASGKTVLKKIVEYVADENAASATAIDFTSAQYPDVAKIVGAIIVNTVFSTAPGKWVSLGINGSSTGKIVQKTNGLSVAGKTGDYYYLDSQEMGNPNNTYSVSSKIVRFSPSNTNPLFSQGARVANGITKLTINSWSSGWIAAGDKITIWAEVTE